MQKVADTSFSEENIATYLNKEFTKQILQKQSFWENEIMPYSNKSNFDETRARQQLEYEFNLRLSLIPEKNANRFIVKSI